MVDYDLVDPVGASEGRLNLRQAIVSQGSDTSNV